MDQSARRATFSERSLRKSLVAYPGSNGNCVLVTRIAASSDFESDRVNQKIKGFDDSGVNAIEDAG